MFRHFDKKDTDTNMFMERQDNSEKYIIDYVCEFYNLLFLSFHSKLKSNPSYVIHNVNRRCDDLIEVLLTLMVDMFLEWKRMEVFTSITVVYLKVEGERHCGGQTIVDSSVHVYQS